MPHDDLDLNYGAGLSDLLQQNLSAYEYYNSLPENIRRRIAEEDVGSFADMQSFVTHMRNLR